MRYTNIVIALGNKCTAACNCCCFEANSNGKALLQEKSLIRFIESSKSVPNISCFHFSGGEVFLHYEYLKRLIRVCSKIEKKTTVITNGYWAYDYDTTFNKLKELKDEGLGAIGISYDEFHKEYIPLQNIRNYIRASKKLGFRPSIQVTFTKSSNNGEWIDQLGEDLVDVIINFMPCDNVGRATKCIDNKDFLYHSIEDDRKLCRKGGTFSVLYDGTIWPCCSPKVYFSNLCLGNIEELSVSDVLESLESNKYLKKIRRESFEYFINLSKKYNIVDIPNNVISACDLCGIFFNKSAQKKFEKYMGKNKKDEL